MVICNNDCRYRGGLMFILFSKGILEGTSGFVTRIHTRVSHWHTLAPLLAHTGTHWHTSLAHTGTINVYRMVIANVLDSLLDVRRPCQTVSCRTKSGGLGVRDCCHAPSANAPRHQTWTSIVWITHQSGCGIKVDRGIKRESIKAMMRCLRV